MSAYTVKIVNAPNTNCGLMYSLVVSSARVPAIRVCWEGYGSPAAARRSIPAAQIIITAKLAERSATVGA